MPYDCNTLSKKSLGKVLFLRTLFTLNFSSKIDKFLSLTMEFNLFFIKCLDMLDKWQKKDLSSSFGERYTSTRDNVNDSILNYNRAENNGAGRVTPKGSTSNIISPTQRLSKKNSLDSDSRFQKLDAGEDGEL